MDGRDHDDCIYPQIGNIEPRVRVIHIEVAHPNTSKIELYNYVDQFVLNVKNFSDNNMIRYNLIHSHYWLSGCVGEKLSDAWGNQRLPGKVSVESAARAYDWNLSDILTC